MPNDSQEFPPCTRCGHTIDEHVRPQGKQLPWPCRKCECPGFVVARELHEDVKHTSSLRIASAIEDLRARDFSRELIEELLAALVLDVFEPPDDAHG